MRTRYTILLSVLLLLFASACQTQPVCTPGSISYKDSPDLFPPQPDINATPGPVQVEIAGKMMAVDRVIAGPVCNDNWNNTVYVGCDIELVAWKTEADPTPPPTFFKNCDLTIEPGTVVYVAAHNDAPYYKGCSCHTGEEP